MTGLGFTSDGYLRSGFYSGAGNDQKGQYQLGGDLQHYRLGNEGDTYIEVGVGKRWDAGNGVKWGVYAMPSDYNGTYATKQAWAYITGLPFAPDAMLWAGQRYHRIQDIHILDNWLMQDGDDYGAGIDGIKVGAAKLNFSASSAASEGTNGQDLDNARRANFQILGIPTNAGGTLDVTGAVVTGRLCHRQAGRCVRVVA